MKALFSLFIATVLLACSTEPAPLAEHNQPTSSGNVAAYAGTEGAIRWLDIPYAQAPVGDLRWRAPRRLVQPDVQLFRREEGVMCPQMPSETSGVSGEGAVGDEDCLYLDVVAPADYAQRALPVMFWIHGGGNTTGRKGTYDFRALAVRESVVVVSFNYRLGPLGWFTHPALQGAAEGLDASSNFGTLDIIEALSWTRRNIAAFGGDPNNITIFGESAGGHNVYSLLASPLAEGLFQKAISQSGYSTTATLAEAVNVDKADRLVDRASWEVVAALGLNPVEVNAEELRGLSALEIINRYEAIEKRHFSPLLTADGIVIPTEGLPSALIHSEQARSVPVMAGSNRDEVSLWLGLNRYFASGEELLFGWLPPRLSVKDPALYEHWVSVRSRAWKARGVDAPLDALAAAGNDDLYAYRFDWDEQSDIWLVDFSKQLGAAHGAEIAFVMGAPMYGSIGRFMYPNSESAQDMTEIMMSAWGHFAREGRPGAVQGQPWSRYSTEAPVTMVLDSLGRSHPISGRETLEALLAEVQAPSMLAPLQRCLMVWDTVVNIGRPRYELYNEWHNGECAAIDAIAEKATIKAAYEREFGSAELR